MAVRSSMAALISRVRLLINDPAGGSQIFADQDIQDVLDQTRRDYRTLQLMGTPTYSGSTIQYLDYYADLGDWEDDVVLKQYLTNLVTPAVSENIVGHWSFATSVLPPIFLTGKTYDVYRAAADLLERWAAKWTLAYDFSSDGQSFRRSQAAPALRDLAHTYRLHQRAFQLNMTRTDGRPARQQNTLKATEIDFMASGDGR